MWEMRNIVWDLMDKHGDREEISKEIESCILYNFDYIMNMDNLEDQLEFMYFIFELHMLPLWNRIALDPDCYLRPRITKELLYMHIMGQIVFKINIKLDQKWLHYREEKEERLKMFENFTVEEQKKIKYAEIMNKTLDKLRDYKTIPLIILDRDDF